MKRLRLLSLTLASCACVLTTYGQVAIEEVDIATRDQELRKPLSGLLEEKKVPALYEGELEDLGPQYLLMRKPVHKYFDFYTDLQWYYTSNATLAENNAGPSDVMVWSNQLAFLPGDIEGFRDGTLKPRLGFRYQVFRYGQIKGDDKLINGNQVDLNDFQARTPFAELLWTKDKWGISAGYRFTDLRSRSTDTSFYRENVFYWSVGRQFPLKNDYMFQLIYDGDYRITHTDPAPLQPTDINNRTNQAVTGVLTKVINSRWIIQPSVRGQFSKYTESPVSRQDWTLSGTLNVAYYFTQRLSARGFINLDRRRSSQVNSSYDNYNLGVGSTFTFRF